MLTALQWLGVFWRAGVPSPFRAALRAIFEGLERSDRHRAGGSQQYQLPIFMTSLDTFQAVQVRGCRAATCRGAPFSHDRPAAPCS